MIVFEDRQLVIITPPHTASGNLHRACCKLGAYHVLGPTPDGAGYDHHCATIGEGWKDYRIACVVRHPLDRLIGLYEHHQHIAAMSNWEPVAWWQFVRMVLQQDSGLSWFYRTTIAELLRQHRCEPTVLVEFDRLADDLREKLGLAVELPPGWTGDRDQSAYRSQINVCLMIEEWAAEDMTLGGYRSFLT